MPQLCMAGNLVSRSACQRPRAAQHVGTGRARAYVAMRVAFALLDRREVPSPVEASAEMWRCRRPCYGLVHRIPKRMYSATGWYRW